MSNNPAKKIPKATTKLPSKANQNGKGHSKEMIDVAVPSSPKYKNKKLILPPLNPKQKRNVLEDLKKETDKLMREIDQLEKNETLEKETTIAQLKSINEDINLKAETIKGLSEENQELFTQLKEIRNEVDEKLKLVKIFKVKENELNKRQKTLQKDLKIIDEELKIAKKNIEIYKNEKEYYERLSKVHSNNSVLPNLIEEIKAKNEEISNIKKRIASLEKIRKQHKNCDIKQKQLQKELDLMQTDFEFERKRQATMTEQDKKVNPINKRYQDSIDYTFLTLTKSPNKEMRQRSKSPDKKLLFTNKSNKRLHVNLNPIHQELNAINENYKKYCATSVFISQHRMNNSDKNIKSFLFKEEEKVILEKLIPNSKLEAYERRFEEIEEQKKELEEKIKNRNVIKKIELKENKEKYVSTELQVTEQKKRSTVLNSQRATLTKEVAIQKLNLKKLKDSLKFYFNLYKVKQKENEKLLTHLKEIQDQIDSGELVLKPSDENDEEEEEHNEDDEEQEPNSQEIEED